MNRLRAGAIVTIPTAAEAQATPAAEATRIVRVQASDWRSYRDRVAAAAPDAAGGAARESGGRIGAAVEDRTPAAAPGSDKLRVSPEAGTGKGGTRPEDLIARDQQLKDAQTRIAALEKTIAEMQRAVELKNQTLAQLQSQADAARGKGTPATRCDRHPRPRRPPPHPPVQRTAAAAGRCAGDAPRHESRDAARRSASRRRRRHRKRLPHRRRRASLRDSSPTSSPARPTGRSARRRSRSSPASPR